MAVKPRRNDGAVWNNASAEADAAQSEIEEVILRNAGADPLRGNYDEANENGRRKYDAANPEAIDQAANKRADRGRAQIVNGEGERDGAATNVKILRDRSKEDAEGVDSNGGLAEEKFYVRDSATFQRSRSLFKSRQSFHCRMSLILV